MTSCCHPHQMPWSGATGAIARCKRVSTGCGRKNRSVRVLRWICGVKLKPKAVNKPLPYFIVHELDKPGSSTTVSKNPPLRRLVGPVKDLQQIPDDHFAIHGLRQGQVEGDLLLDLR